MKYDIVAHQPRSHNENKSEEIEDSKLECSGFVQQIFK